MTRRRLGSPQLAVAFVLGFRAPQVRLSSRILAAIALAAIISSRAAAEVAEFQVNSTLTSLQLVPGVFSGGTVVSGTRLTYDVGVFQQKTGSLSSTLSGTLAGSLNGGVLTVTSSNLTALASPAKPFLPTPAEAGSPGAVDVFGTVTKGSDGVISRYLAVRDVVANFLSGTISVGSPASSLQVQVTKGLIDLRYEDEPTGDSYALEELLDPVANSATQNVTGSFTGTLNVPFKLTYVFDYVDIDDGRIELTGTLALTRSNLPIPGDFDGNRIVNAADLARWRSSFGVNGQADADADGDSDGADFLVWQRKLGSTSSTVAAAAVPEPAAGVSGAVILALLAARRRCG